MDEDFHGPESGRSLGASRAVKNENDEKNENAPTCGDKGELSQIQHLIGEEKNSKSTASEVAGMALQDISGNSVEPVSSASGGTMPMRGRSTRGRLSVLSRYPGWNPLTHSFFDNSPSVPVLPEVEPSLQPSDNAPDSAMQGAILGTAGQSRDTPASSETKVDEESDARLINAPVLSSAMIAEGVEDVGMADAGPSFSGFRAAYETEPTNAIASGSGSSNFTAAPITRHPMGIAKPPLPVGKPVKPAPTNPRKLSSTYCHLTDLTNLQRSTALTLFKDLGSPSYPQAIESLKRAGLPCVPLIAARDAQTGPEMQRECEGWTELRKTMIASQVYDELKWGLDDVIRAGKRESEHQEQKEAQARMQQAEREKNDALVAAAAAKKAAERKSKPSKRKLSFSPSGSGSQATETSAGRIKKHKTRKVQPWPRDPHGPEDDDEEPNERRARRRLQRDLFGDPDEELDEGE